MKRVCGLLLSLGIALAPGAMPPGAGCVAEPGDPRSSSPTGERADYIETWWPG